jgi:hypothetical protein
MKRGPKSIVAYDLLNDEGDVTTAIEQNGKEVWVPVRPFTFTSLKQRVKLAIDVFKGRADALYWPGQK